MEIKRQRLEASKVNFVEIVNSGNLKDIFKVVMSLKEVIFLLIFFIKKNEIVLNYRLWQAVKKFWDL